jgi:hypothetical protein
MYSSTFFGRPHAHHQEFNNCSSSLWFYHCYLYAQVVKPKTATAVVELLIMGVKNPETY